MTYSLGKRSLAKCPALVPISTLPWVAFPNVLEAKVRLITITGST